MSDKPKTSRRDVLIGLALLGGVGGGWQLWANRPRSLTYSPIDGLPGWRRTTTDDISAPRAGLGAIAFSGLDSRAEVIPVPPDRLCRALYGAPTTNSVPVAVFSDFFCPYCRELTPRIARRTDIDVTWHELPLLGPASGIAARAAIAADLQDAYPAFQKRLTSGTFRPTPQFLVETAISSGLNPARFVNDMEGARVSARLEQTRAIAATLGIYGTPAITIGKTLVIGQITDRQLETLIADETARSDGC